MVAHIPLTKPVVTREMIDAASDALTSERLVLGESVSMFEEEFAQYIGVDHAVSVSSGTDALILALLASGVRNREVITTPFSFVATATTIVHAGGRPVFADASPIDYNIDPESVSQRIRGETGAVLPVHLYGFPSDMDRLTDGADNSISIIEDACQAHGAVFKGRKVGSMGDAGCFSFYPTKNMTVGGDGGMVTTNIDKLADDVRKLRDCGRVSRYEHDVFGFTSRLNTANAAFGRVQLRHLEGWNERRRAIARRYHDRLKDIEQIVLPPMGSKEVTPVFHLYPIYVQERDRLAKYLAGEGIDTAIHYPTPIHLQPIYRSSYGYRGGDYPVSERLAEHMLSIPMFPQMTDQQVDVVVEAIAGCCASNLLA